MRKLLVLLLMVFLVFTFAACEKTDTPTTDSTKNEEHSFSSTEKETHSSAATEFQQEELHVPFTPISSVEDYFDLYKFTPPESAGNIQYLFHQPIRQTGRAYPLIIFLHGLGDTVNERQMGTAGPLVTSLIRLENDSELYSTYTLVPTTPLANEGWWKDWQFNFLKELIPHLVENYNIDAKRIYVTGISMGGYTTCRLVNYMPPDTFAAAVPLSGAYDLIKPDAFLNTAFRIYHSEKDTVVNVSCSRSLYQQLLFCKHPNAEYIEYEDGSHTSPLYSVYNDRSFFRWLFAQRLP